MALTPTATVPWRWPWLCFQSAPLVYWECLAPVQSHTQQLVPLKEGAEQAVKWAPSLCQVIPGLPQKEADTDFHYFFPGRSKCSLINLLVVIIHPKSFIC